MTVMVSACATTMSQTGDSSHKHQLDVALHPEDHPFSNVRVDHENGSAVLKGNVKHEHRYQEADAHVDVAILDSAGKVHYEGSVSVSASRVRGRYRVAEFELRFPDASVDDTVVHVAYHSVRLKHSRDYDCTENKAKKLGVK